MDFKQNIKLGNWLNQLNGKTVDKIFQVDYSNDRHEDIYLPWLFFITFSDLDKFLEIQGDFDGDHIRINLNDISELNQKLKDNDFPNEPDLWQVYETRPDETLGKLLGQKIEFVEYGIDKDEFEINGTICKGQKDVFNFIKFNCEELGLTIFEGAATGLGGSQMILIFPAGNFIEFQPKDEKAGKINSEFQNDFILTESSRILRVKSD